MLSLQQLLKKLFPYQGTLYRRIGGKKVLHKLVDDFYHVMMTDPNAKDCLATHAGKDLKLAAEKLKTFLYGWTGGPPEYLNKYGHPRLRMRHFPFSIGQVEADQWLYCMQKALQRSKISPQDQADLITAFVGVTQVIKNRE